MNKSGNVVAPLGNYITLCRKKNKNLESTKLVGVSSIKELLFLPYKLEYEDRTQYLVLKKDQFIVDLINIVRVSRLPVALNETKETFLVSNVYQVFETNETLLKKEYLMLLFRSYIVDRQALFWAGSGVRGFLTWSNFCKISISIPPLDKQERIVKKYQTITRYIELKRRINELFEKQMTAYYHILFDNLTDYTIKNFGEFLTTIRGGRPPRGNLEQERKYFCKTGGIPWLQVGDISKRKYKFVSETADQLTPEGFKRGKCKIVPKESVIVVGAGVNEKSLGLCMISFCDFVLNTTLWGVVANDSTGGGIPVPITCIYFFIKENISKLKRMINSSTDRVSLDVKRFKDFEIKFPPQSLIDKFNSFCEPIFELQKSNEQIIKRLLRMQKCWVESLD